MPSIASASSQPISGFSGLPKLRQSVSASGSPPAHTTLRARSKTAPAPAANGARAPRAGALAAGLKAAAVARRDRSELAEPRPVERDREPAVAWEEAQDGRVE